MKTALSLPLILASASPRRADLLHTAGFDFIVCVADVDETPRPGEPARKYVARLAEEKAHAVPHAPGQLVLAADTTVVVNGEMLAKPGDEADAVRMLRLLAGRTHEVLTGVCLLSEARADVRVAVTTVDVLPMSDAEIAWYIASGEPMDKAGAYGIQGRMSRFVSRIDGSYSNVVGLPVALVYDMLREAATARN